MRLVADSLRQPAGKIREYSCPAKAGFVSDDATTLEGFGKSAAAGEAKPQARARRSCRISSQDDTAHRRFSWSRVSASNGERGIKARGDSPPNILHRLSAGQSNRACLSQIWQSSGLLSDSSALSVDGERRGRQSHERHFAEPTCFCRPPVTGACGGTRGKNMSGSIR